MKNIATLLGALVLLVAAISFYHFSDGQVKKRAARTALEELSEAVASKDRARLSAHLNTLLADDAKIHLLVHFFSIATAPPDMTQDFDKTQFIKFIDDTLYPLTDYDYSANLESLDAEAGTANFNSTAWGDGADMMGGVAIDMRYSTSSECASSVSFEKGTARLREVNCRVQLHKVPKPGQEGKLLQKQGLMDLLQR